MTDVQLVDTPTKVVTNSPKKVAVIGGGISGITAAVKLFRQGYSVTIFEKSSVLGGNLSSQSKNEQFYQSAKGEKAAQDHFSDIYPHIFGDWYKEFWYLLEKDLGILREDIFARRDKINMAMIPAGKPTFKNFGDVKFNQLATPSNFLNLINNLDSKIMSKRDIFLFGYTYLNLAGIPRGSGPSRVLDELDVTGYLYSQPYMNNHIAEFHDDILKVIWSMPANQTSGKAYQNLLRHTITFPNESPFAWMLTGPIKDVLMDPITKKLVKAFSDEKPPYDDSYNSIIRIDTEVVDVLTSNESSNVKLKYRKINQKENAFIYGDDDFHYVVVATPCKSALKLALSSPHDQSMMHHAPSLAGLREANCGRIPVVYLRFNKDFAEKIAGSLDKLPKELIGFKKAMPEDSSQKSAKPVDNDYDISILNLVDLWKPEHLENVTPGTPVLVLAASHADAIDARGPEEDEDNGEAQGFAMIKRLSEYLPFIDPGESWGVGGHIDWDNTRVITNKEHGLFLNDAGAESWRPGACVDGLTNIFFAGDYCRTDVDMATVEAAVQSGILAARALQTRDAGASPICLQAHDIYATRPLLLVKMLATPTAFAVSLAETYDRAAKNPVDALKFPYTVAILASAYWVDWVTSAKQFWASFLPVSELSASGAPLVGNVADHDNRIGLAQWALNTGLALVCETPTLPPLVQETAGEALYAAWYWSIGKRVFPNLRKTLKDPSLKSAGNISPMVKAGDPASTWSGLLKEALGAAEVTPKTLGNVAFGVAATAVSALQIATKAPSATRPAVKTALETKELTFSDALTAAMKAGSEARQARSMAFRNYATTRAIVPAANK